MKVEPMLGFRIKVCGLTRPADAAVTVQAGADGIGLNFSKHSRRQIQSMSLAQEIIAAVRETHRPTRIVGVFVEQTVAQADEWADKLGLDLIQLHGDHAPTEFLCRHTTGSRPILWVVRVPSESSSNVAQFLQQSLQRLPPAVEQPLRPLAGILVDAFSSSQFGGTGQTVAWEPIGQRPHWEQLGWAKAPWPSNLPLVLAGGLTPENIGAAIMAANPNAVDVASGVESEPGIKSQSLVADFVHAANEAFAKQTPSRSISG